MNDQFASEPDALRGHLALKHLLDKFGPLTGRYLTAYPGDWRSQVEQLNAHQGELELARVKTLLRRAAEECRVLDGKSLPFDKSLAWLDNSLRLLDCRPRKLAGLVVAARTPPVRYADVHELDRLELPPTSEERVVACADEYVRVSRILLAISPEIGLIDPYLDPRNPDYCAVLKPMFEAAARGRCESIRLWARSTHIVSKQEVEELRSALRALLPPTCPRPLRIQLNLADDRRKERMHGRYLLTLRGGIRFDHGFGQLRNGRKADVGPISSRDVFLKAWRTYFESENDFVRACGPVEVR